MEFRQITYFIEIYKRGSFSRAAEGLGLTQPALSRQIDLLERELGERLFERSKRKLLLTTTGEKFLPVALNIQELWQNSLQTIKHSDSDTSLAGNFSIATGGTVAAFILPSALKKLRKEYPDLSLRLLEGDAAFTRQSLLDGEVDLGILTGRVKDQELSQQHFLKDTIIPVAARSHPIFKVEKITTAGLLAEEFIFFHPASAIRQVVEKKLRKLSPALKPRVAMELRSLESILRALEAGLGIGFISEKALNSRLRRIELEELTFERDFYCCYRKSNRYVARLIEALERIIIS